MGKEVIDDFIADIMIILCEQKGHPEECHICQPSSKTYKELYKRVEELRKSI